MKDYNLTKIYKIISPHTDLIYIGHTTQDLNKRYYEHKKRPLRASSHKIIDFGDSKIILICKYPCADGIEARQEEQRYIDLNKDICVNNISAFACSTEDRKAYKAQHAKDYYIKNKDKLKEQTRQYAEDNKEKLRATRKVYIEKNRDELRAKQKVYREKNKERITEYLIGNKEKAKEYDKEYREKNKERLTKYKKEYYKKKKMEQHILPQNPI